MKLFILKARLGLLSIARMYRRYPLLILATIVLFAAIFGVLLWMFNLSLLGYVLFQSSFSFVEKVQFIAGVYGSVFTNFDAPQAVALFLFAVLFAINLTMLIYVLYARGKVVKESKKTGLSLLFAIVASGCAACGTSLLTPLLVSIGAGGGLALSREIGIVIGYLSLLLVMYSIYSLGPVVANTLAVTHK